MGSIPLAVCEDGRGHCHQAVRFLSPTQVIRYVNDRNAEVASDALEGSMRVHVPFGGAKIVLHVLAR